MLILISLYSFHSNYSTLNFSFLHSLSLSLIPGITFDTINALEVTPTNLLAYMSNTPALSSFLEDLLIEILYALATIQDEQPLDESTSELL